MTTKGTKNIILLSADALRADHLSCHNYHRRTSPVLDHLASEGLHFTNAYSASSHTREAVPALLTGKYPDVAIGSDYRLTTNTIASSLAEEGFVTAGFHSNPYVSRAYGYDEGFDTFDDDLHFGKHKLITLAQRAFDKLRNRQYARADEINERSLSWLDSLDSGEPFFLWNHYMDTHGPYEPPEEFATLYRDDRVTDSDAQSLYRRAVKNPESITDKERDLLIDLYDAEIRYLDKKIGEFIDALRDRELLNQSLLVFTADHGDAFGEHGYYEHPRYLHDAVTHVPLLIRTSNRQRNKISTPVSTLDIAPTIRMEQGHNVRADRVSLLDCPSSDRMVFLQARGEKKNSQIRRYALRTTEESCFCERNQKTNSISIGECSTQSLSDELKTHVKSRIRIENGETHEESEMINDEIERRLNALGYQE